MLVTFEKKKHFLMPCHLFGIIIIRLGCPHTVSVLGLAVLLPITVYGQFCLCCGLQIKNSELPANADLCSVAGLAAIQKAKSANELNLKMD